MRDSRRPLIGPRAVDGPHCRHRQPWPPPGSSCNAHPQSRRNGASPSSLPTIRTATAGSPTASASIRRKVPDRRSRCHAVMPAITIGDAPSDAADAMMQLLGKPRTARPTCSMAARSAAAAHHGPSPITKAAFAYVARDASTADGRGAMGQRRERHPCPAHGSFHGLTASVWPSGDWHPARARLPHRPQGELSRSRSGAAASLSGILSVAAPRIRRRRHRACRQAR